jgi:hypothetical protein
MAFALTRLFYCGKVKNILLKEILQSLHKGNNGNGKNRFITEQEKQKTLGSAPMRYSAMGRQCCIAPEAAFQGMDSKTSFG